MSLLKPQYSKWEQVARRVYTAMPSNAGNYLSGEIPATGDLVAGLPLNSARPVACIVVDVATVADITTLTLAWLRLGRDEPEPAGSVGYRKQAGVRWYRVQAIGRMRPVVTEIEYGRPEHFWLLTRADGSGLASLGVAVLKGGEEP